MRNIFLLLLLVLSESCRKQGSYYDTINIDGCEYVQSYVGDGSLIHKANCNNPIHKIN